MRTRTLYTMGNPEPELEAIRILIARESGMDTTGLTLYSLSAKNDFGRVYYGIYDPNTELGLLFTISPSPRKYNAACGAEMRQILSEWEIKHLFKVAHLLGLYKFRMLPPLRLFQDEIDALVILGKVALDRPADQQ